MAPRVVHILHTTYSPSRRAWGAVCLACGGFWRAGHRSRIEPCAVGE